MKFLIAAALLVPGLAVAQTPRAGRAVDTGPGSQTAEEKRDDRLRVEIIEFKREVEEAADEVAVSAREKYKALTSKVDELETRAVSAADAGERAWRESRHNFKNQLRKLRRELKAVRSERDETVTDDRGDDDRGELVTDDLVDPAPPMRRAPDVGTAPSEPLNR
ncbi:MAG: hypothetical protein M0D55_20560 [Elusimicrobiota bacterium]|nr:MAG: hypothetical protein M0D55_20560 [Elusimicrobiota bacterium]